MPGDEPGADAPAEDSLRSALETAWSSDAEPAPAAPGPPPTAGDSQAAPAGKASDQPRLPDGTFTHKPKDEAPAAAAPAGTGTAPATRKAPAAWAKEHHPLWDKLDPAIQEVILKRETDVSRGFEERALKARPYEELDQIFQPHRQRWHLNGWSEAQAIQQLLAAQTYLEQDPVNAIRWLAASYGLRPEQLYQQQTQVDPMAQYVAPLHQRIADLETARQREREAVQQHQDRALLSEIESFSKDHPHLEHLRHDMAVLLANGRAETLQEAYDKAIWMYPELRTQILADQAKDQAAKSAEDAARARKAASSITGAPTGDGAREGPRASLREEIEAAFG